MINRLRRNFPWPMCVTLLILLGLSFVFKAYDMAVVCVFGLCSCFWVFWINCKADKEHEQWVAAWDSCRREASRLLAERQELERQYRLLEEMALLDKKEE